MIRTRKEGESIKNGLNFYPIGDKSSFGCVIKIASYVLWIRYSKNLKEWIIYDYITNFNPVTE